MSMKNKSIKNLLKGVFLVAISPFTGFADENTNSYEAKSNIPSVYNASPSQIVYQQFQWSEPMENGYQHLLIREGNEFNMHTTNGIPTTFVHINTLDDFLSEVQKTQGADVVILDDDISINQAIHLRDNIMITGQQFEYKPNVFYDVSKNHRAASISSNADNDLFIVGKNTTVRDLTLSVQNHHAVVTNASNTVGHLTLEHLNANGNIVIELDDGSNDSVINISHNKLDLSAGDNLVGFKIINKSGAEVVEDFSNNQVTFESGNYNTGYLVNNHVGSQTIYFFENNGVNFNSVTQGSNGFTLNNHSGEQWISTFYGNSATFLNGTVNTGLTVYNHQNNQSVNNISMNTFIFGHSSQEADAIYIENLGLNQTIGTVDNNFITIGDGHSNEVFKIYNDKTEQTIKSISNNQIKFTGTQDLAEVFDIENFSEAQIINDMSSNQITFQDVSNASGFAFGNNNRQQTIGHLSNNQFNLLGVVDNFKVINMQVDSAGSAETVVNGMKNNQVLDNVSTLGIILSASNGSSIHINVDGDPGAEVPLEVLSLDNNNIPVQDTKSGGTVMVTEIVT